MIPDDIDAGKALAHVSSMQALIYGHLWNKMTDYGEEQRNELEAIESIYPDSFTGKIERKVYVFYVHNFVTLSISCLAFHETKLVNHTSDSVISLIASFIAADWAVKG